MDHQKLPELIFGWLAKEHENELVSTMLYPVQIDRFHDLDHLMRAHFKDHSVDSKVGLVVTQLYFFVHYQLFAVFTNLLRMHMSEAIACERKAIDATLTAYEIPLYPEKLTDYENRARHFQAIKGSIQKARKNDPTAYPLAEYLLKAHDIGSEYGSHADISSFVLRTYDEESDDEGTKRQLFFYFQKPETNEQAELNFMDALHNFLLMTKVFDLYFKNVTKIDWPAWSADRDRMCDASHAEVDRLLKIVLAQGG